MTGNVNGELRTTASYTGARFNIRFGFVLDHEERAQIRIPDSVVYPQIQVDIDAAISAGDAAAGKMYDTVAGKTSASPAALIPQPSNSSWRP